MAFIDYHQKIVSKVVKECIWLLSSLSPVEMERVILNSLTIACLFNHLDIIESSLFQSVGFDHSQLRKIPLKLRFYRCYRFLDPVFRYYKVSCRIDKEILHLLYDLTRVSVNFRDRLDLIPKHLHTYDIVEVSWDQIDRITPDPETPWHEFDIISLELYRNKSLQELSSRHPLPNHYIKTHLPETLRASDAINTRDRCNDDHIPSRG